MFAGFGNSYGITPLAKAPAVPGAAAIEVAALAATVPGPPSIVELARALQNNVDLIFEWVYSNVDYLPLWYSNKGAFGALVDRIGGPFDQANLMVTLLVQAGYTANFVAGPILRSRLIMAGAVIIMEIQSIM